MTQLWQLSAQQLSTAYLSHTLSPVEVVESIIGRCESHAIPLNAISHSCYAAAREAAKASEQRYRAGTPLSPLDGVPTTIKENVMTQGHINTMGSVLGAQYPASTTNSPAAERLLNGGAILVATTAMTDFGLAGSGASSLHGHCRNPYNPALNTNGSSSGSAAALAVGVAPISIGTDLCGSIRNPAAWCGVVGFKQNFGSIPHLPSAWGRHAGPMTRSVADAIMMYDLMVGPHPEDATSLPINAHDLPTKPLSKTRVGVLLNAPNLQPVNADIAHHLHQSVAMLADEGVEIVDLSGDFTWGEAMATWRSYLGLTGSQAMDQFNAAERAQLPPSILAFNELSAPTTSLEASQCIVDLNAARTAIHGLCQSVDLIISPTIPVSPFSVDHYGIDNNPVLHIQHLHYTGMFNLTGQPAITLPAGFDDLGMPVGIQLASNLHTDRQLLAWAQELEAMLAFDGHRLLA